MATIVLDGTFAHWRAHARGLLAGEVDPQDVTWVDPTREETSASLFSAPRPTAVAPLCGVPPRVARVLAATLETAACHADPSTWALMYRIVWRSLRTDGSRLDLADTLDADVSELQRRVKNVRRDAHKMHAFVRFRRIESPDDLDGERFVAWHRPRHRIAEREAGFFVKRFPSMAWSILTPHRSAHWDGSALTFTDGLPRPTAPSGDELEALWVTYYKSIFNPARLNLTAMRAEMPQHHWPTMPEARAIPELVAEVPARLAAMAETSRVVDGSAAPYVPATGDLDALSAAARGCRGCELCFDGTQVVFGEGRADARLVLLGEQPGDEEERAAAPFVGPAGRLLDELLGEVSVDRGQVYVTNAVKHFKHRVERTPHGKRRIHAKPGYSLVSRCQPWFEAEMAIIRPSVLVCLGATAVQAVFGPSTKLKDVHGSVRVSRFASATLATFHPAAILRARSSAEREERREALVASLRVAHGLVRRDGTADAGPA